MWRVFSIDMASLDYAELHCHSAFSFLSGANQPETLVERAREVGLYALALTDTLDLGGIPRFGQSAREAGIAGIIGAELIMEDEFQLVLLACDLTGYSNISSLISKSRMNNERGEARVKYDDLFANSDGLIVLSGDENGAIASALYRGEETRAVKYLRRLKEVFASRFYIEVCNHHLAQESRVARRLIEMAVSSGVNWVVANSAFYARPADRIIHDALVCLKHRVTLDKAGRRLRPNGSWYIRSPEEMLAIWRDDLTGIKNSLFIADQCRFRLGWLDPPLPDYHMSEQIASSITDAPPSLKSLNYSELLRYLVFRGAAERYGELTSSSVHLKQLEHELALINSLKLAPYFLIMWDIVRFAQLRGIAVQGRGSAANSAVCYCLKITAVDPIAMDLLFERFLSEGRSEPPDIDLDIAHHEREQVLQYVYNKYGRAHAAMVCEVITYRGRSAVRDAAFVLGFSQEQADMLASLAGHSEARGAAARLAGSEGDLLSPLGFAPDDRRIQLLIKIVSGLHQLPRHRSIHVGGFVLSARPVSEVVPIEPASMADRTVIQWDKDDLDLVGLIKIDLLGLGMLTMIQEALKLLQSHRGINLDIGKLDMKDASIYAMLQKADTVGVFQVESRAQMNILPKLKPVCFYDIIVSIAIVRPGPIQGNIIHPYLRRRQGLEPVRYLHPSLEPILKRTLGVPLFQEQGMKLAVIAAGFTASQADQLRKVMSHKRSVEKMAKLCHALAEGMAGRGFSQEAIETVTHQLRAFASYGFPESHAASFSLLVYASAYLKRYFPAEFYCAMLNAQPMGFYSPSSLIGDARRHGVVVLPADLAFSSWNCTLEPILSASPDRKEFEQISEQISVQISEQTLRQETAAADFLPRSVSAEPAATVFALRLGLRFIDGLGSRSAVLLEAALEQGPFESLADVVERSGFSAAELKILARAGAFETFVKGRRQALWQVLSLLSPRPATPLLDYLTGCANSTDSEVELPDMTEIENVIADYSTAGLTTGAHPMTFYRAWCRKRSIVSCLGLRNGIDGDEVEVAGGVICRQRPETAKGFVFLTLEDESGMANVVVNPKVFEVYRRLILDNPYLRVRGRLQLEQGVCNVIAKHFDVLPALKDSGVASTECATSDEAAAHSRDRSQSASQNAVELTSRNFR
ncbi:MAG: DNA polymerase III subunit alpha [Candidatus Moraniibacteriota bacterium]|nr:MAG: DNA polymerase III subunit alpha [Candidatus Moranbacteria bacterium]